MTNPAPLAIPVLILGAGAWGTAMAVHWARRAKPGMLQLWGRNAKAMTDLKASRTNSQYLPGITFPDSLAIQDDLQAACLQWRRLTQASAQQRPAESIHGLIVLATPMSGLQETAQLVRKILGPANPGEGLLWLAKGLRQTPLATDQHSIQLHWPHQIVAAACPDWPMGACSGPSFAQEVAMSLPVALSIASHDLAWARAVAHACHGGSMRLYATSDLIGVELGGAMKNVLAIAAGVCDGLALGANARAALLTRGLIEMARLGVTLGAQQKTFLGLATLGDLILTATGDLSRNRRVGLALARGEKLNQIVQSLGHVAEGVATAPALLALARQHQVDTPITQAVCQLLNAEVTALQAIENLLLREPKDEQAD
jgi:glycerol-3-phosphate dehydrogenase (NAD(P)+)